MGWICLPVLLENDCYLQEQDPMVRKAPYCGQFKSLFHLMLTIRQDFGFIGYFLDYFLIVN